MSSRKRIQRKNPWQPTPAPDILKSRPFSNGKGPRESRLPTTSDILRTRPFASPAKKSSPSEDTRSFCEKMKGAEFGYNAANIPVLAPSTTPPSLQPEEVTQEDTPEESAVEEKSLAATGELEKPPSVAVSPQSGTIQRLCDECEAEKSEEKHRGIVHTQAEIPDFSAKDFNQYSFKPTPQERGTEILSPKRLPSSGADILANNELPDLSITKRGRSRIRAKRIKIPTGNTEIKDKNQPIQAKLTVAEAGDKVRFVESESRYQART